MKARAAAGSPRSSASIRRCTVPSREASAPAPTLGAALGLDSDGGGGESEANEAGPVGDVGGVDATDRAKGPGHSTSKIAGTVKESIGSVRVATASTGVGLNVNGNVTDTIGAARVEMALGNRAEEIGGSKTETALGLVIITKGDETETVGAARTAMIAAPCWRRSPAATTSGRRAGHVRRRLPQDRGGHGDRAQIRRERGGHRWQRRRLDVAHRDHHRRQDLDDQGRGGDVTMAIAKESAAEAPEIMDEAKGEEASIERLLDVTSASTVETTFPASSAASTAPRACRLHYAAAQPVPAVPALRTARVVAVSGVVVQIAPIAAAARPSPRSSTRVWIASSSSGPWRAAKRCWSRSIPRSVP